MMLGTRPQCLGTFVVCAVLASFAAPAAADVVLTLKNGRHIRAQQVDPRSDARQLVIKSEASGIRIARTLRWNEIAHARLNGTPLSSTALKHAVIENEPPAGGRDASAVSLRSQPFPPDGTDAPPPADSASKLPSRDGAYPCPERPLAFGFARPPLDAVVVGVRDGPLEAYRPEVDAFFPHGVPAVEAGFVLDMMRARKFHEVLGWGGTVPPAGPHIPPPPDAGDQSEGEAHPAPEAPVLPPDSPARLRGISVTARPISIHGKADFDALAVDVEGYDANGRAVPVEGTLRAALWVQSQRLLRAFDDQLSSRSGRVRKLATWTRRVTRSSRPVGNRTPAAAVEGGGPIVLPLPRPLPEHDLTIGPFGELQVELMAPSVGVLEAAHPGVLLRHVNPLRDRQLMNRGSRFFAEESTHGSRRPGGVLIRRHTSLRPNGGVLTVQP